jgi:2,4-dichlorophenol 6-monooxygenase
MNTDSEFDTDVVVVGMGPTGATTALALATYGIRVHAVSQWNWCANTPRAHITNQRAVEVLRDLGIEEEVKRYATSWEHMGDMLFTTSFAGQEVARIRAWGTGDERVGDYIQGSPCPLLDVPQTVMEPLLVKNAAERGAQMTFNTLYRSHVQDENGVTVTLENLVSGAEYKLRARYLVGADGARSQIAEEIGLPFEGELARAGTAYILFEADLSRYVAHRPSTLYWIMTSIASFGEIGMGLLRAIRPWDEWIAGWGFDMAKGEPDLSDEPVIRRIRAYVGDPNLDVKIKSRSLWYVNQQYANSYSKGRVFCGGDAVHRHPPSSGLGSNTCMQDAFNLAWKLAYVIKGYAEPKLLDSYSDERVSVGKQIVARANQSRKEYSPLRQWYARDAEDFVTAGLQKLNEPSPEGVALREQLYKGLEIKNYEFNGQGVELNQRYRSNAVIPDPKAREEVWQRDPQLYVQPTTRPGAKIPHAWLVDASGRRVSTLDVTGNGKFSLVTGLGGAAWAAAAKELELPYLRTIVVGAKGTEDLYGAWHKRREIHEAGALLVRPDGYIAWRQSDAVWSVSEARQQLVAALRSVLGADIAATTIAA